ncbi:MAG: glycosyltransferase family 2 protein [Gammaproteobacteria bacterium]|nr:glycosyltransferase family 2 protein [Gammaproteobacteria bacterium]
MQISATVITLNEEKNIQACVKNLLQVCDEVLVLDSQSQDQTQALARQAGATLVEQAYLGDGPQKAFAAQQAKFDWVLSIDADERLDEELIQSINEFKNSQPKHSHYAINRKTYIGDEWAKVWYPDYVIRLYDKQRAAYQAIKGHSEVQGESLGRVKGHILHFSYESYLDMIKRIPKFSGRGAEMLIDKNKSIGYFSPMTHGMSAFFRKYIAKKGFLHGSMGLTVSVITAFGTFMKYAMARQAQQKKQS